MLRFGLMFLIFVHRTYGFSAACPEECDCFARNVDCSNKELFKIPSGINNAVRSLVLKKNNIGQLQPNSFDKLQMLRQLNLGFNVLQVINEDDFNGLLNLRTLDLSYNEIKTIHKNSFKRLPKIDDITLRGNKLTNVDGVFTDITEMTRLDLSHNQIDFITSETFRNMTKLRYLLLGFNKISMIHDNAFYDLTLTTYISMSGNPLTNIDGLFVKNNVLSFIELTNCSLSVFPKGVPLVTRFLYLDRNNISSIMGKEIERVESLVNLVLSENQIVNIEKTAFTVLTNLMELWINFNKLTEIPLIPVSAKRFHLDNNEITHILPEDFPFGSTLETLSIKNNKISAINQDTFKNLRNLRLLYLGGNMISTLPNYVFKPLLLLDDLGLTGLSISYIETEAFNDLSNLQKLSLSYVDIEAGSIKSNVFKYLTSIKILDLQDSPQLAKTILTSPDFIRSFFTLEELNIKDNELSSVNSNLMTYMPRLSIIKLGGNPFHCDRSLLWLQKWIDMQKFKFEDPESLECATPEELEGSSLLNLKADQFVPTTTTTKTTITQKPTLQIITEEYSTNSSVQNITIYVSSKADVESTTSIHLDTVSFKNRHDRAKYHHKSRDSYDDQIDKILLIAVVTTISVVLFAVIITGVSCLKCGRKKLRYNHSDSLPENDVTFYVINNGETAPPLPPPNSAKRERGSVSSTCDITNDNVFIFDNDSS